MSLTRATFLMFLSLASSNVFAQTQKSCWVQWTERSCSNTDKSADMSCTESKRIYEECRMGEIAERERKKRETEAAYRDKKRVEIEAVEKANEALKKTQTLNGSRH